MKIQSLKILTDSIVIINLISNVSDKYNKNIQPENFKKPKHLKI